MNRSRRIPVWPFQYLLIEQIGEPGTYLRKQDGYFPQRGISVIVGNCFIDRYRGQQGDFVRWNAP